MLDGTAQLLSGEQVVTAERGDLVIVPPGLAHAFAAAPGEDADILIVITPGVERFEYFRHLERIAYGKVPPESLLEVQERYDTYFLTSTNWNDAGPDDRRRVERGGTPPWQEPRSAAPSLGGTMSTKTRQVAPPVKAP
jgi:hypothetical protein